MMNYRPVPESAQNWPYGATVLPDPEPEAEQESSQDGERNTDVIERVRELLEKYPGLKSGQLHDMAQRMDPSLRDLTLRSFHARYVLPVKRERARAEGRLKPPTRGPRKRRKQDADAHDEAGTEAGSTRSRRTRAGVSDEARKEIRDIILRFAGEVAATDSRSDLIQLIGGIDDVVAEIISAVQSSRS